MRGKDNYHLFINIIYLIMSFFLIMSAFYLIIMPFHGKICILFFFN